MVAAVILAGGYGTRLGKITKKTPKPMISVGGIPVIDRIISSLVQAQIDYIFVHLHYLPLEIMSAPHPAWVNYCADKKLPGTARAVLRANWPPETKFVLVVNGDTVTNINYRDMLAHHITTNADVTVYSPHKSYIHTGGTYLFNTELFYVKPPKSIQAMLRGLKKAEFKIEIYNPENAYYFDIGTPEGLRKARRFYASKKSDSLS